MGVIAVHLGMAEEAGKLFVSSRRYDLLVALQQVGPAQLPCTAVPSTDRCSGALAVGLCFEASPMQSVEPRLLTCATALLCAWMHRCCPGKVSTLSLGCATLPRRVNTLEQCRRQPGMGLYPATLIAVWQALECHRLSPLLQSCRQWVQSNGVCVSCCITADLFVGLQALPWSSGS